MRFLSSASPKADVIYGHYFNLKKKLSGGRFRSETLEN